MRHLDLAALRSLVAVSDAQTVTAAAAQVNLTQSAVSMQIKRLEQVTGARLLERKGRGVVISDAGEQLVGYARRLLALNDEAWSRLTHDEYEGEVNVGVPPDIVYPRLPAILKEARSRYPRIRVNVVSALTKTLKSRFLAGDLDLTLATEDRVRRGGEELLHADLCWMGAVDGKAHLRRPLPVALCNSCAMKPALVRTLAGSGLAWEFVGATDNDAALHAMVSADLAVTVSIDSLHIPNCERLHDLPPLPTMLINLYVTRARNLDVASKIADVIRDVYSRESSDRLALAST